MTLEKGDKDGNQDVCVIYSFKSRWLDDIRSGRIGVFFRKRGPSRKPARVFIYAGAPISSIVAVADVDRMEDVDLVRSLELANLGRITDEELRAYIGPNGHAKAIFLKNHRNLHQAVGIKELRNIFNFHPPQNFMQVSSELADKILEAASEKKAH